MSDTPDIVERLNAACVGHPNGRIPWPHQLLHDAVAEIARLRAELVALRKEKKFCPEWRHVTRGTEYQIIGSAMLQASTGRPGDGTTLILYRGEDGKVWARAIGEFHDGRFVSVEPKVEA